MAQDSAATDPICGKPVDKLRARAIGIFAGKTYFFCSAECKARFADPRREVRADTVVVPPADAVVVPPAEPPAPTPPPEILTAPPPTIAPSPAIEARRPRRAPWVLVTAVLAVAGFGAWRLIRSRLPAERPLAAAPPAPMPVQSRPPPVTPVPEVAPPSPAEATAAPSALVPPLELGLHWFVVSEKNGTHLVERLLVVDAAGHATVHEIGRVDMHGDVTTRGGSAPRGSKAAFAASTSETGVIYEDSYVSPPVHLDVRVTRLPRGLVAETRSAEGAAWRTTLTIPLPADARVRGAHFAKKRFETSAR